MGSGTLVKTIEYRHQSYVVIEDVSSFDDCKYWAHTVDREGFGAGNTTEEAVRSLAQSFRKLADEIEGKI